MQILKPKKLVKPPETQEWTNHTFVALKTGSLCVNRVLASITDDWASWNASRSPWLFLTVWRCVTIAQAWFSGNWILSIGSAICDQEMSASGTENRIICKRRLGTYRDVSILMLPCAIGFVEWRSTCLMDKLCALLHLQSNSAHKATNWYFLRVSSWTWEKKTVVVHWPVDYDFCVIPEFIDLFRRGLLYGLILNIFCLYIKRLLQRSLTWTCTPVLPRSDK